MKAEIIRHRSRLWRTFPCCLLRTIGPNLAVLSPSFNEGGEISPSINGGGVLSPSINWRGGVRFHFCDANLLMWRKWTKLLTRRQFICLRRRSLFWYIRRIGITEEISRRLTPPSEAILTFVIVLKLNSKS